MDHCDKFSELLEQCNDNYGEAYAITTRKVAEYASLDCKTKEQREEEEMWKKVKNMIAGVIADIYVTQKGYRTKCIKGAYGFTHPYFAKPEEKEQTT